jgi:putative CocE/NonD family hydrolase
MKKAVSVVPGWLGILCVVFGTGCSAEPAVQDGPSSDLESVDHSGSYEKREYRIEVRDGVELYTAVYLPRDTTRDYPILLRRTPYSCGPYGPDGFPRRLGPSSVMEEEGYIFACQDVRGRYMSEGQYDNMRPHVAGDSTIDESSDTYDTVDWMLANVPGNNGKVGMWGISYPGFYAAAALPEAHPALVASSPQAPIAAPPRRLLAELLADHAGLRLPEDRADDGSLVPDAAASHARRLQVLHGVRPALRLVR